MIGTILGSILLALSPFGPLDDAAALADYNARRAEIADTADAHWKLGLWAEEKGLKGEATVEFMAVLRLEPTRESAWKKLGFVKRDGRWVSTEQIAAEKAEAEARRKADAKWLPILKKAKAQLGQKAHQAEAVETLVEIKDPRAIPSIWKVFGQGTAEDQEQAIDLLGRIDDDSAAKALAGMAIFGKTEKIRKVAVETLTRRNDDDVLMLWVGLLNKPVKYEVRQVAGPGSAGYLTVEGENFNVKRSYSPPTMSQTQAMFVDGNPDRPVVSLDFGGQSVHPPSGSILVGVGPGNEALYVYDSRRAKPGHSKEAPTADPKYANFEKAQIQGQIDANFEMLETARMAEGAQAQLQQDVNTIEAGNAVTRELNARLAEALRRVSGKDFGDDKEAWLKWYMERRGYTYIPAEKRPKPTVEVQVPLPYVPRTGPAVVAEGGGQQGGFCVISFYIQINKTQAAYGRASCFAAGTIVLTPEGSAAIETLKPGDRVLTSDGPPGQATRPGRVLAVHHAPIDRTIGLTIRGETVVATEGHPLWKLGQGWTRAGALQVGDRVATRSGPARVEAIESRPGAEVWNLEIADGATYHVGQMGLVAHDLAPIEEILGQPADDPR